MHALTINNTANQIVTVIINAIIIYIYINTDIEILSLLWGLNPRPFPTTELKRRSPDSLYCFAPFYISNADLFCF